MWTVFRWMLWPLEAFANAVMYIIGILVCISVGIFEKCDQVILGHPHGPQWPPLHPHAHLNPDAAAEEAAAGPDTASGPGPLASPNHPPQTIPKVPIVPIGPSPLATNPPITSSEPSTPHASSEIHSLPDTPAQPTTPALPPGASPPILYPPRFNPTSAEPYTINEEPSQAAPAPTSESQPISQDIPQGHPLSIDRPSPPPAATLPARPQRPSSAPRAPGSAGSPTFGRPQSMPPTTFQPLMESPQMSQHSDSPSQVPSDGAIVPRRALRRVGSDSRLGRYSRHIAVEEWLRTADPSGTAPGPDPVEVRAPITIPSGVDPSLPMGSDRSLGDRGNAQSQDLEPEYFDTRTFAQRFRDRLVGRPDAPELRPATDPTFSASRIPPSLTLMSGPRGGWGPRQPPAPTLGLTTTEAAQAEFPITIEPPAVVPPTRATHRELAWDATHYGRGVGAMLPGSPVLGPYLIGGVPVPTTPFPGQDALGPNPPSAARVPEDIAQGESEARPAIITNQTRRVVLRRVGGIPDIRSTLGEETRHNGNGQAITRSRPLPRRATAPPLHDPILDTSPSPNSNGARSSRSQSLPAFGSEDYSDGRLRIAVMTVRRLPSTPRDILPGPPSSEEQRGRSRQPRRPRAPTLRADSGDHRATAHETPIEFLGGQFSDPSDNPSPSPIPVPAPAPDAKPTQHLHLNGNSRQHAHVRPPLHELPLGPFEDYLFEDVAIRTASPRPMVEPPATPYEEWVTNDDPSVPDIFNIGEVPSRGSQSAMRSIPPESFQPLQSTAERYTDRGRETIDREGRERIPIDRRNPASDIVRPPDLVIPQFGQAGSSHWAGALNGDDLSEDSNRFDPSPIEATHGHPAPLRYTLAGGLFPAYESYRQRTGRSPPGFIPRQRTGMTETTTTTSTGADSVESVLGNESDDERSFSELRGNLVSTRNSSTEARENSPINSGYRDAVLGTDESRISSSEVGDIENIPPPTERPANLRSPVPVRAYPTALSLGVGLQERYRTPPIANLSADQASTNDGATQLPQPSGPAQDAPLVNANIGSSIDTSAVAPAEAEVGLPSPAVQPVDTRSESPSPTSSVHEFTSTSHPRIMLEEATPELSYAEFGDTHSPDSSPGEGEAATQFVEHVDTTAVIPIPARAGRYLLYDPGEGPDTDSDVDQGSSEESASLFISRDSPEPADVTLYPLEEGEEDPLPPGNPFIDTPDVISTPPKSRTPSPAPLAPPMILGRSVILAQRPRMSRNASEESTESRVSVHAVGE